MNDNKITVGDLFKASTDWTMAQQGKALAKNTAQWNKAQHDWIIADERRTNLFTQIVAERDAALAAAEEHETGEPSRPQFGALLIGKSYVVHCETCGNAWSMPAAESDIELPEFYAQQAILNKMAFEHDCAGMSDPPVLGDEEHPQ